MNVIYSAVSRLHLDSGSKPRPFCLPRRLSFRLLTHPPTTKERAFTRGGPGLGQDLDRTKTHPDNLDTRPRLFRRRVRNTRTIFGPFPPRTRLPLSEDDQPPCHRRPYDLVWWITYPPEFGKSPPFPWKTEHAESRKRGETYSIFFSWSAEQGAPRSRGPWEPHSRSRSPREKKKKKKREKKAVRTL